MSKVVVGGMKWIEREMEIPEDFSSYSKHLHFEHSKSFPFLRQ